MDAQKSDIRNLKCETNPRLKLPNSGPSDGKPRGLRPSPFNQVSDFDLRIFHADCPASTTAITVQRAGLLSSPTSRRAASPSEEMMTR